MSGGRVMGSARGLDIRNTAYIPLIWKDIRIVDMNELGDI